MGGGGTRIHPTQKSEKIINDLIDIHTVPGDKIFDPFSGSGQISLCALKKGRIFLASEIDKTYWKKSNSRIKQSLVRPAINHLGNKFRMIQDLIPILQAKNTNDFIDVFAGSSIVSASIKEVEKYWLNDSDKNLCDILRYLLNTSKENILEEIEKRVSHYNLDVLPYKDGYLKLRNKYNKDKIKKVQDLLVLVFFSFNQQIRFNSKGDFNIPPGKTKWTEYQKNKIYKFIESFGDKKREIHNSDFGEFVKSIQQLTDKKTSIYYFDPPYFITNATYNSTWSEDSEKRLISLLDEMNKKGYKWVLSNVLESKDLSNDLLKEFIDNNPNFNLKDISVQYKNSNYQRKTYNSKEKEIILSNF